MMDGTEILVVTLGAVIGVVLAVIALAWRGMIAASAGLPLWGFLRREGITRDDAADAVSAKTLKQAELACSVCGNRAQCRALLAANGAAIAPANCPNAPLFDDFGIAVDKARK